MEVKNVAPTKVFYHSEETTLNGIHDVARREIENMYKEAAELGLNEVAPMQFVYHGVDDNPDTKFTLEIAIVVDEEKPYNGKYRFKTLDGFKCAATTHNGSINELAKTYDKFMPELYKSGVKMTSHCREVYHKYLTEDSADNITEIQIGIN